jgi:glycerophosphoryl diester phosphodiesterase
LSAVRSALAMGADMVEVDVRRTRDGALVLMHDPTLVRTTDAAVRFPDRAPWRVQDFTLAEVRTLDAGAWKSSHYVGERVPTLTEVLQVLSLAGSRLLLEVKQPGSHPGIEHDVASLLHTEAPRCEVVVQSFHVAAMHRFAWEAPHVPTGVLAPLRVDELHRVAGWASYCNPHHRRIDAGYVDAVHASGMRCYTWTVDGRRAVARMLRCGVDGVITNRPEVAHDMRAVALGGHRAH